MTTRCPWWGELRPADVGREHRFHRLLELQEDRGAGVGVGEQARTGRFEFRAWLPGDVNADAVQGELTDGVLTLTIPKSETAKPGKIEIKG